MHWQPSIRDTRNPHTSLSAYIKAATISRPIRVSARGGRKPLVRGVGTFITHVRLAAMRTRPSGAVRSSFISVLSVVRVGRKVLLRFRVLLLLMLHSLKGKYQDFSREKGNTSVGARTPLNNKLPSRRWGLLEISKQPRIGQKERFTDLEVEVKAKGTGVKEDNVRERSILIIPVNVAIYDSDNPTNRGPSVNIGQHLGWVGCLHTEVCEGRADQNRQCPSDWPTRQW